MAEPHPVEQSDAQLLAECTVQRLRRSGPGGQHRNKVETAVRICHLPTGLTAEASERRSQAANGRRALSRLRLRLALGVRRPDGDLPSQRWKRRLQGRRICVSRKHGDFSALLAEALDVLHAVEFDFAAATSRLSCSTSQLTRFLKMEPQALAMVNRERDRRGLRHML
jgi:hypothetical protein